MGNSSEVVYLELWRHPVGTEARFGYKSKASGHQVWDSIPWLLGDTPMTEEQLLNEFYAIVLALAELRA